MKDIKWFINRLKAMKPQEIAWRVQQKRLQQTEERSIYSLHIPVTEIPLDKEFTALHLDIDRLPVNWDNNEWSEFSSLDLFGAFDYETFRKRWNAGFQTDNNWPEELFSPTVSVSQRTDIGDIRTNWELNRHFQFATLAKSYYCTKDKKYLEELIELFEDWNKHNLFLHGVEWTSAMELAIRVNSWVYTLAFLKKSGCNDAIVEGLEHGILVMTGYITKHRACFSSANNHLIVEMYAVALVGILTDYAPWRDAALRVLTDELPRQNYSDGVNKEMSTHYQSFVMEAYGLLWLLMTRNNISIPETWKTYLTAMTEYIADATDECGATMEFGDSDEGKILDLFGTIDNHFQYVLNLMSCVLDKRYTDSTWHENLNWIVPEEMKKSLQKKSRYTPGLVCSRKEGGYTFLRSRDRRVLIGIDHADLGFGSIAAHGHADALSFQMFIDGQAVLVDSGTFNYHFTPEDRYYFRSTAAHNTVRIENKEQSEMLGPFIWGRKSKAFLVNLVEKNSCIVLTVMCDELPFKHVRVFSFDQMHELQIHDHVNSNHNLFALNFHPRFKDIIKANANSVLLENENMCLSIITETSTFHLSKSDYSEKYNNKEIKVFAVAEFEKKLSTSIRWSLMINTQSV